MQKAVNNIKMLCGTMENISFYLLAGGFFCAVYCLAAALIIQNNPAVLTYPCDAFYISRQLFELGGGFAVCAVLFGFLSDIVIKHDFK